MVTNQNEIKLILKRLQCEGTLDYKTIQSLNNNLKLEGYDFQILYCEQGYPYFSNYFEIQNIADCQIQKQEFNTTLQLRKTDKLNIIKCKRTPSLKITKNGTRKVIVTTFMVIIGNTMGLFGYTQRVKANDLSSFQSVIEQINKCEKESDLADQCISRDYQKNKDIISAGLKRDRQAQKQASINQKKLTQIISSELDPASKKLKNSKEQNQFLERVTSSTPSINKQVKAEFKSATSSSIEQWILRLLGLDSQNNHSSSKKKKPQRQVFPVAEALIQVRPSRTTQHILQRGRQLNQQTRSAEDEEAARFVGPFQESRTRPSHFMGSLQASRKWTHSGELAATYGLEFNHTWTNEEKGNVLIDIVENHVLKSPDLQIENEGTLNMVFPVKYFIDKVKDTAAAFAPHPTRSGEFYLHTVYGLGEIQSLEVRHPDWNGNLGQSPAWHDRKERILEIKKYRNKHQRSFWEGLQPDAKIGFKQVDQLKSMVANLQSKSSDLELSPEQQAIVERVEKFSQAEAEYRERNQFNQPFSTEGLNVPEPESNIVPHVVRSTNIEQPVDQPSTNIDQPSANESD